MWTLSLCLREDKGGEDVHLSKMYFNTVEDLMEAMTGVVNASTLFGRGKEECVWQTWRNEYREKRTIKKRMSC